MRFLTSEGTTEITSAGSPKKDSLRASEFLHRAMVHHQAGCLEEADAIYQSILQTQPQHPDALHLSGVIAHQTGKNEIAVNLIEKAIKVNPNEPDFYNNCGEAYRALGKYDLAINRYKQALAIKPYFAGTHYNLGLALQELGCQEEAIACYEQALAIKPYFAEAHNNLGVVLQESGYQEEAIACYEQALVINPYLAEGHNNLGVNLKRLGKPIEAIIHHQKSIRLKPEELIYRITFSECLSNLQITQANDSLKEDIITTFSLEGINHQELAFASASIIKHSPDFQELATFLEPISNGVSFQNLLNAGLAKIYSEPLLLALLKKTIIRDRLIERVFTITRRSLLHEAIETEFSRQAKPELVAFVCAIARQCFFNEYIYAVSEIEAVEIKKLIILVTSGTESIDDSKKILLAILASYIPLYNLKRNDLFISLLEKSDDNEIVELITQQIVEPNEEKELRNEINTLGIIDDEVSQKVRAQYEENPYPRWLNVHKLKGESVRRVMKRSFPYIPLEQILDNQAPDILIAGCGTGQQVINRSFGFQSSKVLGVDISLSSLSYAKRKARELKLTNVEFIHADLLNLHLLNKTFDIIECIGVLHHMDDLVEGWNVLANVLNVRGLMRIGLYSKIARKDIVATQSFIAEKGYPANSCGIRKCRQDIFAMPHSSIFSNMTRITDFYTLSETRDLLFHVQENQFTLLQIAEIINKLGLTFIGFDFDNPLEQKRYLDRFPDDPTATSLHNWHKYEQENSNAFIGLYLFWVQKRA
jgi:tetratricopeptide (TPR) repeat protein/ubiquinone/menaquinone biosynthesis C-methylase UbiE